MKPIPPVEKLPEHSWQEWLNTLFSYYVASFAPHHEEFWNWVWAIQPGDRPPPFIGIWPRGGGKSTNAEIAVIALGARRIRKYVWYVSSTQEQADQHVENISAILESEQFGNAYPELSERMLGKYGRVKGWNRSRLRTASGFTIDAIGLDKAVRGSRVEEDRPGVIIFDDIDAKHDSPLTTRKKKEKLTETIIPAGTAQTVVLGVQNVVIPDGIFAQLADGRADFLIDRHVSGPHPAILDFSYEQQEGEYVITGGTATWEGQNLAICQSQINTWGLTAFLKESQHEVEVPPGGMFNHLDYRLIDTLDLPELVRTTLWVDPAVSDTKYSDHCGIQIDGIDINGIIYRLWSWEQQASPDKVLQRAILKALEFHCQSVGVETDQGGEVWRPVYKVVCDDLVQSADYPHINGNTRFPKFASARAGAGHGSKVHRASLMLADYERGRIVHVRGTHDTLHKALNRFPLTKPFDLVDAAYWSWNDLRTMGRMTPLNMQDLVDDTPKWKLTELTGSRWR